MGGFLKRLFSRQAHTKQYIDSQMERARICIEQNNKQAGCKILEEIVKVEPSFAAAWHWLGATRIHTGDLKGSRTALEKAMRLQPDRKGIRDSIKMLEATEKLVASADRTGSVVFGEDGKRFSRNTSQYTCASCGGNFTESGTASLHNRAYGGALCRSCGNFYCEACVSRVVLGRAGQNSMTCECGKSRTWIGASGSLSFENFSELVVFRA